MEDACPHQSSCATCRPCEEARVLWESARMMALGLAGKSCERRGVRGSLADDMQQAALLGLWQAALRFRPEEGFKFTTFAWYYVMGEIGKCWHNNHGTGHANMNNYTVKVTPVLFPKDAYPTPDHTLSGVEILDEANAIIDSLPSPRWRLLVRMYYMDGLNLKQIAAAVGLTRERVGQVVKEATRWIRARHARKALRS